LAIAFASVFENKGDFMGFIKATCTALVLSTALGSAALAADVCFNAREARDFHVSGNDLVTIRTAFNEYDVHTFVCPQLTWADRIGFDSFGVWVCTGDSLVLTDFNGRYLDRCYINSITQVR
jgi:hypothetical protein